VNIKETKIILFADDTNIFIIAENGQILQQRINRVMKEFHSWLYLNSLFWWTTISSTSPFPTGE
jgi:hypothetical protein